MSKNKQILFTFGYSCILAIVLSLTAIGVLPHDPISIESVIFGIVVGFISGLLQAVFVVVLCAFTERQKVLWWALFTVTITNIIVGYLLYAFLYDTVAGV